MLGGTSKYKPDDTIYCQKCETALKYNKQLSRWDSVWSPTDHPEVKKCKVRTPFGQEQLYDHVPLGNTSRLLRAARRMTRGK